MEYLIGKRDSVAVVAPPETLAAETLGDFHAQVDQLVRAGARYFVVDLGRVTFVDGAGLAALVQLYKQVRIGEGDIRLAAVAPTLMHILELTRLNRVFDIFPTVAAAAASLKEPG